MKLPFQRILKAETALGTLQSQRLPIRTLYKLSQLQVAVAKEMEFYRKNLHEIIDEYGLKDENGNVIQNGDNISIQPDKIEECNKRIEELLETEVDLPDTKLKLEELEKIDTTMEVLSPLMVFIEE